MIRLDLRTSLPLACALALAACSSGGGDGPSAATPAVSARGGTGRTSTGGGGGAFIVSVTPGGGVSLRPGVAPPALAIPIVPAPDLGANPRTLSSDATLLAAGPILGDDGASPATGLWVKAGATLTLDPDGSAVAYLLVDGAIRVDGTVVTTLYDASQSTATISLRAAALHVSASGRIDGTPPDSAGDGLGSGGVTVRTSGAIVNAGAILARGGRGTSGGHAGELDLGASDGPLVNTGVIDGSGGEGTDGAGGSAIAASLWGIWGEAGTCDAHNLGRIVARGGNGARGGGDGGYVYLSGCAVGDTFSAGELDASGGAATVDGPGGAAAGTALEASDGRALVAGVLRARGGRAANGPGGAGGSVAVLATGSTGAVRAVVLAQLDAGGGDGTVGGDAGAVVVRQEGFADGDVRVEVGTGAVDAGGGDGADGGGNGGWIGVDGASAPTISPAAVAADGIAIEAALRAAGGAGGAGEGGVGGHVHLAGSHVACGAVAVDGGASAATAGGVGGTVDLASSTAATAVAAPLTARGGAGTPAGAAGAVTIDGAAKPLDGGVYRP
ncbi:PE-PGRS family protein [Anaeromyxobacter dehalogenans 2CP-1]|uniref:PE-PGRS family protein n=1 Tax=Anaeromyxobacter dehalogenans (strain ATCC BAA-258 / DSM 21875 / 2CP-1) TaxID=455488 RepID=B8JGR2_ANAD2|nr:hypothetical protein [Anaeromyxobacter dehalogenans]ACL66549.1 PE-PGRS family protein [Anaeromyxobacter dehalogenans 2CP-1]